MTTLGPFVAREDEVGRLTAALARAGEGDPGVVLVGADAGVGKTRLLAHVSRIAVEQGATAVTAACVDLGEVGLPYLPFAGALGQLHATPAAQETVEEVARTRPALARLLPGLGAGAAPRAEDETGRLQLFDGIAATLAAVGAPGRPLLLVLEDLHWADPSTRDVLRYLVARLRDEHLLVVGTYRTDDLHRTHPLRPFLSEMWRHARVERIDLAPFTPPELREFAAAVRGAPLPDPDFTQVLQRSEGNAYFAEELLQAGDGSALPWSLAEVLRSRVERLDPDVQELARVASVGGRIVSEPLLRAVAEHHTAGDVDRLLREAMAANVLGWEEGRVAFRHALLAEAVYEDLLPGEQVRLHRAYRDAILADPSLASAARLAHHATRCQDTATALVASLRAADEAASVVAPQEEHRHLEKALRLWASVPDAADVAGTTRVAVLERAAGAASRSGDHPRAVALGREALTEPVDDPVLRAHLRVCLARHLLGLERERDALEQARLALDELPDDAPPGARAWALATHARTLLVTERDDDAARDAAERAAAVADAAGDAAAAADALATLAVLVVDDPDHAARLLIEARERAREAGDLVTEQRCHHNLVTTYYYAGRLEEAAAALDAGFARNRETGLEWSDFGMSHLFFDRLVRYCLGDLGVPEAISPTHPVSRAARRDTSLEPLIAVFDAVALYSAVARGDEDAIARGQALRPMWERDSQVALLSGGPTIDALTWAGRLDEAVQLATELIEHLGRTWDDYFLGGIWLAALAIAALADGAEADRRAGVDPALKVRHGDELLERARAAAVRGRPRGGRLGPEGVAWLRRAEAEHARLAGTADPELWRRAVEAFSYGYRYEVARSRWRLAEALLHAGDRDAARAELDVAHAEAVAMGARPLAEATAALARRARLDVAAPHRGEVLTDREAEVLELVAQGLTNRQIGERLFISGKTVSVHVSNVLAKLGATSRAEAVAIAHRRGLLAG
ncbi:MAG: AAA family ATPase [Actinomycetales bacterium]|nr:AAA family ATPase [Actinomycetales bacterium]